MITRDETETLARTFFFYGIAPGDIDALFERVGPEVREYGRGQVIYSPEDFRRELGFILRGSVTVTKGALTVSELSAGDLFGAAALFTDEEKYVSTLTVRSACRVLFLSQAAVGSLIDTQPVIRENYIRYLAQRIRFLSAKVDALASGTGERKLSDYLLKSADGSGRVTVRSMTELASRLGIGRASLYRELSKLTEAGVISHSGKNITLLKPESLK